MRNLLNIFDSFRKTVLILKQIVYLFCPEVPYFSEQIIVKLDADEKFLTHTAGPLPQVHSSTTFLVLLFFLYFTAIHDLFP